MSSPTVPSYVFPDNRSPSPTLLIPTPITLPVLAPLPVSAYYVPVSNEATPVYWSDEEGVTTRFSTPEYYPPVRFPTPEPPTSPRWTPSSPPAPTITPPPETPASLTTPELSFTPVIPPGPFDPVAVALPANLHRARSQALKEIYERLLLSNNMRERVHRVIGVLWNYGNMTAVTHRVTQGGNPALFDFLEMFQNIINMEFHAPGTQQVQDHLTVDLALRMLEHGIEHEIYCAMHGASWGRDNDPIFHNPEIQDRAGVNRPFHASIHDRPPPAPRMRADSDQQARITRLLTRGSSTQRDLENQNQALRNLLRDMETPAMAPLNWEETSFLDNIISRQTQVSTPSSVTTIPPFDSLNPTAPTFVPARPQTPHSPRHPRQPFTEISMNNPQDLSLVTRRARRRQRNQNATTRRPNIPPPPPTQPRAPQTARRGRPRRQAPRPQRPDPFEGFYDAAGEYVDGYHDVTTIDQQLVPTNAERTLDPASGRYVFDLYGRHIYQDPSNYLWYYLISNQQVPHSEFFIPQTSGRLPSRSVIHEGRLYFDGVEIYFDHNTRRWRSREGNNPLPNEPFLGPGYVPGNPQEALPEHLRTQSTAVVGPVHPGTVFSANTESSDEEGTSGTDNALEYVSADQAEDAELEQQGGDQSEEETHIETVVPPTPLNLELLQIEPPVVPTTTTETPDVKMSQAPPPNNHQGGGGGAKLPLPEDFTGVRSKCSGFLASIRAYFSFYPNQFASDAQKITLALMCCKGAASMWRDSEFAKFNTDPVSHRTWLEFRMRFINQWEEVSAMASAMIKIQKLELGKKYNMTQLISRFDELIPYCKIQDNEPMKIHFFTQCFPDNIKTHIFLKNPTTYDDARKYATEFGLAYDRIDADNGKRPRYGTAGNDNYNRQQRDPNTMDVDTINFEEGTNIRFTKLSPSQVEDYKKQGKCFNCRQKGHMSRMCPTKKKGNGGWFQKGGWKGKGKPSQSIRSAETEEEPAEENRGEGSSSGNDIARIRAMIKALDEEDRIEVLGKDF
ncbi:hypothetical protein JOM56_000109 [Amanita muscaria]